MSEEQRVNPIAVFRHELEGMAEQFTAALPKHIPVERFGRVLMTAVQQNPRLLQCSKRSLWQGAMKAAQDGLLPDGREGAIVEYKGEAQWLPMIAGLRKKVRNSGEIATWEVHVVHEADDFEYELGDEPFIKHRPALSKAPGPIIAAYSVATLKSGEKSREIMSIHEVEAVRSKSRAQKGPWADPVFYPEMVRKTVARRHSKVLPMSTDLDDLIRRDDALYDFEQAREEARAAERPTLAGALDALAARPEALLPQEAEADAEAAGDADDGAAAEPEDQAAADNAAAAALAAFETGGLARAKGIARKAMPGELRANPALAEAWLAGWDREEEAGR
jgi:recombination protein RecT